MELTISLIDQICAFESLYIFINKFKFLLEVGGHRTGMDIFNFLLVVDKKTVGSSELIQSPASIPHVCFLDYER